MSFEAECHGTCVDCDLAIRPGQEIDYSADSELVHVSCPVVAPAPICTSCFVVLPLTGICDDCG